MEISKRYNSVPVKHNCALFAPTPYIRVRVIWRCHLNFLPADPCCHDNEFWDKIDYNLAPVKDNCTLFAPTSLFSGPGSPIMSLKSFFRPLLPWQRILGQKLTITRHSWKIIASCFYLSLYFQAHAIRWCHLNLSSDDPCCHGNELFWDKNWLQLGPRKR